MNAEIQDWPSRHRLTVDDYYRMAEVGVLAPDARVELIEGEIIDMTPPGSPHAGTVNLLLDILMSSVRPHAIVSSQSPARLSQISEPQPDLLVLRARDDFYRRAHPTPADVLLLVEVSDSSLRYDRKVKAPLYAKYGVPEVWIVDVKGRKLHIHRRPLDGEYADMQTLSTPGVMTIAALPDVKIDLSALFVDR